MWLTHRIRQLGIVDAKGRAATHTGACTSPWAGAVTGDGFSVQGNMLACEEVVSAMAEAYAKDSGSSMVVRLMAALEAGEAAGGDNRGKQAAGILVTRESGHWTGTDRYCDLRVDDHAEPVAELCRILTKVGFLK